MKRKTSVPYGPLLVLVASMGGCAGTMGWQHPSGNLDGGNGPDACFVVPSGIFAYDVVFSGPAFPLHVVVGRKMMDLVEFELRRYYSPRVAITARPEASIEMELEACPKEMVGVAVRILSIEGSGKGQGHVSARAQIQVALRDVDGRIYKSELKSPEIRAAVLWFVGPMSAAAGQAVPLAIQESLRQNLDSVQACRAGHCKTDAERASPPFKWAHDLE